MGGKIANLRELMQTLVLIPREQERDVVFRAGDDVAKLEGISLLDRNGKFTLELRGPRPIQAKRAVLTGKSYTITDRAEIQRLTGGKRIQTREDGVFA
jgi:hypothetical protein